MWSKWLDILTRYAMQSNASDMTGVIPFYRNGENWAKERFFQLILIGFIAFVVVKLQIFIFFHGDAASMKWPLLGGFWVLSPPNIAPFS